MASGLTLVFGLMDVLNFGHGAFIALGAYVATLVLLPLAAWSQADLLGLNLAVLALALLAAVVGLRRSSALRSSALLVAPGLWPASQADPGDDRRRDRRRAIALCFVRAPESSRCRCRLRLRGSFILGDAAIEKYRIAATIVGLDRFRRADADPQPHQDRPADPRRRREPRNGRGARLSHRPAVHRRVHGGLGPRRTWRRAVGALSRAGARLDGRRIYWC